MYKADYMKGESHNHNTFYLIFLDVSIVSNLNFGVGKGVTEIDFVFII